MSDFFVDKNHEKAVKLKRRSMEMADIFSAERYSELKMRFDDFRTCKADYQEIEEFMERFDEDFEEIFGEYYDTFFVYRYEHNYSIEKDTLEILTPDLFYRDNEHQHKPGLFQSIFYYYEDLLINLAMSHEGLLYDNSTGFNIKSEVGDINVYEWFPDYFKPVRRRGLTARFFQRIEKNMRKFRPFFRFYLSFGLIKDIQDEATHGICRGHGLILINPIEKFKDYEDGKLMRLEDLSLPLIPIDI